MRSAAGRHFPNHFPGEYILIEDRPCDWSGVESSRDRLPLGMSQSESRIIGSPIQPSSLLLWSSNFCFVLCTIFFDIIHDHSLNTTAKMQGLNRVKTVLDKGQLALGVWQLLPGSNMSRTLARAGYDWVLVDCEHGNIDGKSIGLVEDIND